MFVTSHCFAQDIIKSLRQDVLGQGKIVLNQDPRLDMLIRRLNISSVEMNADGSRTIQASGYRVQLFAGNNSRRAKNLAYQMAENIKELFPELSVYTSFAPPRWLCRVGDFRTIEEADATMRRIRATKKFKEVSIVREKINITF